MISRSIRWIAGTCLLFCLVFLPGSAAATRKNPRRQVWSGYLIDLLCAQERYKEADLGARHTQKCLQMPACDHSGFGILLEDNRVLKFDNAGNLKVRNMLHSLNSDSKLKVRISGSSLAGDSISVTKIELAEN